MKAQELMWKFGGPTIRILSSFVLLLTPALGVANVVPTPRLDPNAPSLPKNAKDIDKLGFAASSLWWARAEHPIKDYQPNESGKLDQVQLQLLEALDALNSVPDSTSDELAKGQEDKRANIIHEVIKTALEEGAKTASEAGPAAGAVAGAKAGLKEVLKVVVQPTVAGDGQGPTRDALKTWITSTLYAYTVKGHENTDPKEALINQYQQWVKTLNQPSDGASMSAVDHGMSQADFKKMIESAEDTRRSLAKEKDRETAARQAAVEQTAKEQKLSITPEQLREARENQAARSLNRPPLTINHTFGKGDTPAYELFWEVPVAPQQ
jgi:hypothetical protein